jgi:hypothetical protein
MTWSPDSSITGSAQTSLTDPTYTVVDDIPPQGTGAAKQLAVTALGGTQPGVSVHSASSPFTATLVKPTALRPLPAPNPVTGLRGSIPNNQWKLIVRKGGEVAVGVPATAVVRLTIDVPAGMETYNAPNIRAMLSLLIGLLNEESADLGDSLVTGVVGS